MWYTLILFIQLASSCFKELIGILHKAGRSLTVAQVAEFVTESDDEFEIPDIELNEGDSDDGATEDMDFTNEDGTSGLI